MTIADLQANHAAGQEMQRQVRMMHAWRAYYGDTPRPLKVGRGELDDNVRLNFARLVVDKGVSFLFGGGVGFAVEQTNTDSTDGTDERGSEDLRPGDTDPHPSSPPHPSNPRSSGPRSAAQAWLEGVWRANRQDTFLQRLAVNGGVCGHAWVKVKPGAGEAPPRLIALDPQQVNVLWEPDDYEDVVEYRLEWTGIDPRTGRAAAYRQVITRTSGSPLSAVEAASRRLSGSPLPRVGVGAAGRRVRAGWLITDQVSEGGRGTWATLHQERWPWEWPPVLGCQNLPAPNEYWGVSDLEADLMDVSRSIDFTMSNIARILKFHAHPKTWVRGLQEGEAGTSPDGIIYLPTKTSEIGILEMESDLGSSLEFYKRLKEALHEMARIPEVATGKVEHLGPLSGTALQVLYQPLIEKTQTKRLLYGDMLAELGGRLLEMGGFPGAAVRVVWPAMLPEERGKGGDMDA